MPSNHVSGALNAADQKAVLDAAQIIREKLPFLVDLSVEERRSLPRMADKTYVFVRRALEVATQNEGILPRTFDLEEFRRDVALVDALAPVGLVLTNLAELIDDTRMAAGSDAYTSALFVYHAAQLAGLGQGLDDMTSLLGRRFSHRKPAAPTPPLAAAGA